MGTLVQGPDGGSTVAGGATPLDSQQDREHKA